MEPPQRQQASAGSCRPGGMVLPHGALLGGSISYGSCSLQSWLRRFFLCLLTPIIHLGRCPTAGSGGTPLPLPDLEKTWSQTATHKALSPAQIHTSNRGWRKIQLQALLHPLTETLQPRHTWEALGSRAWSANFHHQGPELWWGAGLGAACRGA